MRAGAVGLGLIGGSMLLALRDAGFATRLVGVDRDERHADEALALGLVDEVWPMERALAELDLVILAVPVSALEDLLPRALDLAGPGTTVTDVGSTKAHLCAAVAAHPRRGQYVAGHPMAGTENSGPQAARRGLFPGKTAVLCERERSHPEHVERVVAMYRALGMRLVDMGPDEHDLHAAYVSHLSHVISFVLASTVLEKEADVSTIFHLAGGGFESTARLARSAASMWTPIFEKNRAHVVAAVDAYLRHLTRFRDAVDRGDPEGLSGLIDDANRIRRALDELARKGGR